MIIFQKIESLAIFLACLFIYSMLDQSWWWFVLLFITPDLSMLGYLKNPKTGAIIYNTVHNYATPILLALSGALFDNPQPMLTYATILAAHIALDRVLGFGLKLSDSFKNTHLSHQTQCPL